MILKETLRSVVRSQRSEILSADLGVMRERTKEMNLELPHALIISGVRRCGKSTVLRQIMKKIDKYYYLNFEDTRLVNFEAGDFEKLDEIFREEYGDCGFYLFDEIQNVPHWEVFVRSRLDRRKRFVITGSNASLLSRELGTRLTGRHLNLELFPFSFNEMLLLKGRKANVDSFEKYLELGGFPEYLKYGDGGILRELFTDIIQRDIVARHKIRASKTLEEMALYLLTNAGKEFSYNSLKRVFGLKSTSTVVSFVSYFEDSYLLFTIPKFDYSLKKQLVNQKKVYSIDNGLSSVNSVSFSADKGRMLENMVFLRLRRDYADVFYFRENGECDFLVKGKNKIKMAVQVTYGLTEDNKKRELGGVMEAMRKFDLKEGLILTYDQEDEFNIEGRRIVVKPVWKWMQ